MPATIKPICRTQPFDGLRDFTLQPSARQLRARRRGTVRRRLGAHGLLLNALQAYAQRRSTSAASALEVSSPVAGMREHSKQAMHQCIYMFCYLFSYVSYLLSKLTSRILIGAEARDRPTK